MIFFVKFFRYIYSLFFCLRYLPISQAVKVPIYIHHSVRIKNLKRGNIIITAPLERSMITWGFETGSDALPYMQAILFIKPEGKLVFKGSATISAGTSIQIERGIMEIGNQFYCNYNCYLRCTRKIIFGEKVMLGWNITLNTSNGHQVFYQGKEKQMEADIIIGDHVWIASYSIICKGTQIVDNCIVSQMSLVMGNHSLPYSLIAGNPAKIIKNDYNWS